MNLVFHSSIPFSLKPLRGSTFSQTLKGSRVVWVIASIAIAVLAVSVAVFRLYLASSSNISKKKNWTSINNMDKMRDLTSHPLHKPTQNIPSNSLDNFDPYDNNKPLGLPVDPTSTFLQNNASHLNKSDDELKQKNSSDLGMYIYGLQEQIESENQLLSFYTQDDEVKEINGRIQELQSKLDKAMDRYKLEIAKENFQTNGGIGINTLPPVDTSDISSPIDTQNGLQDNSNRGSGTNLISNPVIISNPSIGGQNNPSIPQDDSTSTIGNSTVHSNVPVNDPSDFNSKYDLGLYIVGLQEEIQFENDALQLLVDQKDIDYTKSRIQALKDDLDKALEKYKRAELRLDFQPKPISKLMTIDVSELTERLNALEKALPDNKYNSKASHAISNLSDFIDLISNDEQLMTQCFTRIDEILFSKIFSYNSKLRLVLDEDDKSGLKSLQQLFPIVNKYISFIEKKNKELATRLKIKFANLPVKVGQDESVDSHIQFPNLYINEVEQVRILIDHFQRKEDKKIDEVLNALGSANFSQENFNKIAKMAADDRSHLSKNNRLKLQDALRKLKRFPIPSSWSYQEVQKSIHKHFLSTSNNSKKVQKLWQTSKAKQFFEAQAGKNEDEIHIPRWYHATKHNISENFFDLIAASGEIKVMHKGSYKGAWVSNQRESSYGDSVFIFSHRIRKIHPKAKIRTRNNDGVRWRGLQKDIPFIEAQNNIHGKKEEFLSLIGIRNGYDKNDIKTRIIKDLREKKGLKNPVIFSVRLVDYIHKNILKSIGCPNFSSRWWGSSKF